MKYEDDELYHVYNRGSRQGKIFFRAENYRYLIELVLKYSSVYGVRVAAYCLMPNHYHFVLRQLEKGSISSFLRTLFNAYAQAVNIEQRLSGSLFQGKAQSRHIESDEYALQVIRYIHLNPVETHLVSNPEKWEFSDYNAWCGIDGSTITDLSLRDAYFKDGEEYRKFVSEYKANDDDRRILLDKNMLGEPSEGQSPTMENLRKGTLYIVATPIGNLEDITYRAVKVLSSVDLIAAEDTRKTKILLEHYKIVKPMLSYFSYNERARTPQLIERLLAGQSIAVVSDAGTPGISDPAHRIIMAAIAKTIPIIPIPGPSAFLSALIVSGLRMDNFVFEGFLPHKKGRKTRFQELGSEKRTIILYESPHRVIKTLKEILEFWGDRQVVVARELTKKFEEVVRGKVSNILRELSSRRPRGEYVILVEGVEPDHP